MIKIVYQKYTNASARVGYAPPIWKRAQVKGLKESRPTIRVDEDQGLVSFKEVYQITMQRMEKYKIVLVYIVTDLVITDYIASLWMAPENTLIPSGEVHSSHLNAGKIFPSRRRWLYVLESCISMILPIVYLLIQIETSTKMYIPFFIRLN